MLSEDKEREAITWGSCPRCGYPLQFRERADTIHYGELFCGFCRQHIRWVSRKPGGKKRTSSKHKIEEVAKFHSFTRIFCFFCGRDKSGLARHESLTSDHIIPQREGGEDELSNLQILCDACHTLKNWVTTYLRKHHSPENRDD